MKICYQCKVIKEDICFAKRKDTKSGLSSWCKNCRKKYNEASRIKEGIRYNLYLKERRKTIERRFVEWKRGAKKRGIDFLISIEDCKNLPLKCYYTGMDITFENYKENTVSLDRINSNKPYTKDNIVFCCKRINEMKSNMSVEDFITFCEKVTANKENILTKTRGVGIIQS